MLSINKDINLLLDSWTIEDFRRTHLQFSGSLNNIRVKVQDVYQHEVKESKVRQPWKASVAKADSKDISDLAIITKAFDVIATRELDREAENLKQLKGIEKNEEINEQIKRLNCLASNLQAHDEYIREYNRSYVSLYPTHEHSLKSIQTRLATLSSEKKQLEKPLKDRLNYFTRYLKAVAKSEQIDWHDLLGASEEFKRWVALVDSPEAQRTYLENYQSLFNKLYMQHLSTKGMKLSKDILALFTHLGFSKGQVRAALTKDGSQILESIQDFQKQNLAKIEIPQLKNQLQEEACLLIAEELGINSFHRERIKKILRVFQKGEKRQAHLHYQALNQAKKETLHILKKQLPVSVSHQFNECFNQYFPESNYEWSIDDFLDRFSLKQALEQPRFFRFLRRLRNRLILEKKKEKKLMNSLVQDFKTELFDALREITRKEWIARNAFYQRFSFDQLGWKQDYDGNEGTCVGVNYRWIKELLRDPFKPITSYKDFDPDTLKSESRNPALSSIMTKVRERVEQNPAIDFARAQLRQKEALTVDEREGFEELPPQPTLKRQSSSIGVKPEDLRVQARYEIEKDDASGAIPKSILIKDRLRSQRVVKSNFVAIGALIESIAATNEKDPTLLGKSSGIFEISFFKKMKEQGKITLTEGHVLGMQIDPVSGIYRFWDVNSGFYSYPNLRALKKAAETYMDEFYGRYPDGLRDNHFYAIQYY